MGRHKKSTTQKAAREVERRLEIKKAKRFNDPLKVFIHRKYPQIFEEYMTFYEYLHFASPKKDNLLKTPAFLTWLETLTTPAINILATKLENECNERLELLASVKAIEKQVNERLETPTIDPQLPTLNDLVAELQIELLTSEEVAEKQASTEQINERLETPRIDPQVPTFNDMVADSSSTEQTVEETTNTIESIINELMNDKDLQEILMNDLAYNDLADIV